MAIAIQLDPAKDQHRVPCPDHRARLEFEPGVAYELPDDQAQALLALPDGPFKRASLKQAREQQTETTEAPPEAAPTESEARLMAGGPPVLNIGAEGFLGWGKQAVFGTPTSPIAANANNWGEFTAIDLNYDAAWHAVETGAGSQATERKAGRGMSKTQGGFTTLLQPTAGGMLLACFLGADVYGTPVAAAHNLSLATVQAKQMLTFQKIMAGQALQYQDCFLDTLVLGQAGAEWTAQMDSSRRPRRRAGGERYTDAAHRCPGLCSGAIPPSPPALAASRKVTSPV
jgi:hypothetical protein